MDSSDGENNAVTIIFTYFNRLTCAPQYHSTSDAPCTLKIASCEAKLPHNTHLLRLSFWRLPTSGTGNSLTDIKVFSIHSLSITARAIYSCSPIYSTVSFFGTRRCGLENHIVSRTKYHVNILCRPYN